MLFANCIYVFILQIVSIHLANCHLANCTYLSYKLSSFKLYPFILQTVSHSFLSSVGPYNMVSLLVVQM